MSVKKMIQAVVVASCFALASVSVQAFACDGHGKDDAQASTTTSAVVAEGDDAAESCGCEAGCEAGCDKCGTDECPNKDTCKKGKKAGKSKT